MRKPDVIKKTVNAVSEIWRRLQGAPAGRVYRYDPSLDDDRTVITRTLTFSTLNTILQNGEDGTDIGTALALFAAIEREDGRIRSVAGTRRRALTGLDFEIVSAADKQTTAVDEAAANEAADYCREHLDGLKSFKPALKELAKGIGPNVSVIELVWEYGQLIDLAPIPTWRLTMNMQKSLDIRVLTQEERTYGVAATSPKFVVHVPEGKDRTPIGRAIHYPQAVIYLLKRLSRSDWGAFCELFGMPVRVGKYRPNASSDERTALKNMVENIGSRGWAVIPEGSLIEFVESAQRATIPFQTFIEYLDRETGILWLGGNLTADTSGGTGTYSAAAVQERVRDDILDADIEAEETTLREQLLAPMCAYKFPGRDVPVPYFERSKPEDSIKVATTVAAWQKVGLKVPADWARNKSGIPEPKEGDELLEPPDAFAEGVAEQKAEW